MQQIHIKSDLLYAQPLSNRDGYTWTLVSRLGEMLYMAEDLFGPRDRSYTILGVEFVSDSPRIWYPGNCQHIIIQLDLSAATNMFQACYQLAHETIHLLAPTGGKNANNLEEGVACYFAAYYLKTKLNAPNWRPNLPSYKRVLKRVAPILDADLDCVRRLRNYQPSFSRMCREDIHAELPNLTSDDVDFLIAKFDRNSG